MCTVVQENDPKEIGFSCPDELDVERINFFKSLASVNNGNISIRLSLNVNFDRRFMAKLGLGIGYCLFGEKVLATDYGKELRKGMWCQDSTHEVEEECLPLVRGASVWMSKADEKFSNLVGEEHAVSLIIVPAGVGVAVNINIGQEMSGTVMCAATKDLDATDLDSIREGKVILIYKYLQTSISLPLPEYLAYKTGHYLPPSLAVINERICKNRVRS
jgi:hypothetical protein